MVKALVKSFVFSFSSKRLFLHESKDEFHLFFYICYGTREGETCNEMKNSAQISEEW